MMAGIESISNKDEFFSNTVATVKEGFEQHRTWECLKGAISKAKVDVLGCKKQQILEKIDKTSNKTINKVYAEYK